MNFYKAAVFAIPVLALVLGYLVLPFLPSIVPIHWNISGNADATAASSTHVLGFAGIMIVLAVVFWAIPKLEVFKENMKAMQTAYWQLGAIVELFLAAVFILTLLAATGSDFNMSTAVFGLIGILFLAMAFLMPKFKRTFFVGIRTPWTLSNDTVWKKTHEFGSKTFALAGIAFIAGAVLPESFFPFVLGFGIAMGLLPVIYSYLEYRKNPKNSL